jgi:hypothetical protein
VNTPPESSHTQARQQPSQYTPSRRDLLIEERPDKIALGQRQKITQMRSESRDREIGLQYCSQLSPQGPKVNAHHYSEKRLQSIQSLARSKHSLQFVGLQHEPSLYLQETDRSGSNHAPHPQGTENEDINMNANNDSHDWYRDLVDSREDARRHTDRVAMEMRDEMRQDRQAILSAINASEERLATQVRQYSDDTGRHIDSVSRQVETLSDRVTNSEVTIAGLLGGIRVGIWLLGALLAVATLVVAIVQVLSD